MFLMLAACLSSDLEDPRLHHARMCSPSSGFHNIHYKKHSGMQSTIMTNDRDIGERGIDILDLIRREVLAASGLAYTILPECSHKASFHPNSREL